MTAAAAARAPRVASTIAGLASGWIAFTLAVWIYGEAPRDTAAALFAGTWGTAYGVGQVLYKATTLLLAGVAVDVALRAGLFNIGVEGQLAVGGLAAAAAGSRLAVGTSAWIALPCVFAAALVAGALWVAIPAALRALGAHEVISTIMMNRIADSAIALALAWGVAIPGTSRTPGIVGGARLPRLDALGLHALLLMRGSAASIAWPIALAVAALSAGWFARSRIGREIELVGLAPAACAAERIPVRRRAAMALLLSGALAGLAAIGPVLGYKGYFESGIAAGAGFGGIAVALLARRSFWGLVLAALFFGTLEQGGLAINARVPMEVMTLIEAVAIVAVALADARSGRSSKVGPAQ